MADINSIVEGAKSTFSFGWVATIGGVLFQLILVGAICFGIYWFVIRPLTYKIEVTILAKRGVNLHIGKDRGKYVKKKGQLTKFLLLNRPKVRLTPPDYQQLFVGDKGKTHLILYKISEDEYIPCDSVWDEKVLDEKQNEVKSFVTKSEYKITNMHKIFDWTEALKIRPIENDVKSFTIDETQRQVINKTKSSMFEKYAPMAMFVIGAVLVVVMLWMTLGKVDTVAQAIGRLDFSPMNNLADAIRNSGTQVIN